MKDILDEENIHVGQLQTLLQQIDSSADKIAEGEIEATQQITNEPVTVVAENKNDKGENK
ncbi:hypothetical protein [uncultured Clostridium sp.]|uniref:hypothetical protein n=1 Tax=uncultured Clostridium sp. TaxID=59620 RepID=UPI0026227092|nr:hypothetical protein [uncultured Clostridium sp.]